MSESLVISEIFRSIQGEGLLTGVPSIFVRTSGCNLRCRWCDTPYTSWEPEGERMEAAEVLARVEALGPCRHVVLTGGEPLLQPAIVALAAALSTRGHHLTVETAGTVWRDMPCDLWSVSPKLSDSTPQDAPGGWTARHEARRHAPQVLERMLAAPGWQLKLVVGGDADLVEVDALLARLGEVDRSRVLLMPQGRTVPELDAAAAWLVPQCIARGVRFCDRLHVRLFGNTRGT